MIYSRKVAKVFTDLLFTIYNLLFTIYDLQFMIYNL